MSIICVLFFFRYITFILLTKLLRLHPQLPLSVTAGRTVLRLFMCSEDSVVTGKTVRRVVDKALQERFRGVGKGQVGHRI